MTIFVFDIETVPDTDLGRRIYQLVDVDDHEAARFMLARRQEETGSSFLPLHLHRIVTISGIIADKDRIHLGSWGALDSQEADLVTRFFNCIDKYTPILVSWNGSTFDLPVLHYRALKYNIAAPTYWDTGETESTFRWNNYLNRYHYRHMDLMDILSAYQARAYAPLHEIALLANLPGKLGLSGDQVLTQFQNGQIESIRNYCEIDVLNTYLLYLQFSHMRGKIDASQYHRSQENLKDYLQQINKPHLDEFLSAWRA
jgi:3'-5' exonuclease